MYKGLVILTSPVVVERSQVSLSLPPVDPDRFLKLTAFSPEIHFMLLNYTIKIQLFL